MYKRQGEKYVGPWLEALRRIGPEAVTIYTVARETPVEGLSKACLLYTSRCV